MKYNYLFKKSKIVKVEVSMKYEELFESSRNEKKETFTRAEIATMLKGTYSKRVVTGDDPEGKKLDRYIFHRGEEYEVISLIQDVLIRIGSKEKSDVSRIERLIKHLPSSIRGRKKVINWLVDRLSRD